MEDSETADSEPIPKSDDASPSQGKSCALCGCATPAVRCDRCNSQIFCLSCDDMYHRHPKRKLHLRKAVDSIWTTARSPRLRRRTELPGDPCKIPIPPPRSKKRERHTIGGRIFLKSGLELGSFGHSKVFDPKNLPMSRDFFSGQKSPASLVESNCDVDTSSPNVRSESGQIYENDNMANPAGNLDDRSPWNPLRPNISSPIQVSIPSSSPDIVANGQSFGYPAKPHSQSAADLTGHAGHPVGHQAYPFHPPYPYMHHPPVHPYSHSMAHLNCAQCLSSSWSNLISPHPSPYFHPMPWGSAHNTLSRHPVPGQPGTMKHSHGDLPSFPDSGFHYPYPGGYYHNGPPVVDPNFIKDLHEQAEMQKSRKEVVDSKLIPGNEEMDTSNLSPADNEPFPNAASSAEASASANQDVQAVDESPMVPEKPTEPWECVHCTFINPPGIYICQVCCKTSYGNKSSPAAEEQSEMRPHSRDSESPLINRDALLNSPEMVEFRDAQKDEHFQMQQQIAEFKAKAQQFSPNVAEKFTTETQTLTTTKTTDVQTQNITRKSIASSTDSIFPKQEISVQTEVEAITKNCSVATDPMISSQSLESLLSGVSAPPYHNRRAGWGRGASSFSTQSLYERGRSRSPMPRSLSFHTEAPPLVPTFASEEAMHSASQAFLYTDPMYFKPHNRGLSKEDYFDGTWGSMDRLNRRVNPKKSKEKLDSVRPKFHRSLDDLKSEKRTEIVHTQELLMLQTVKEAERCGFTLEDLHVAYLHCAKENPVFWLEDNWPTMIKNVIALAAKYGEDNEENDVGAITITEAKEALRIHRGDIWDAVAECIETRQRKILELTVRGNFSQKQISEVLKNNEGNVELAYADLLRASTRRHKFILSPGLSTDSEDLNVYNPTEDTAGDHNLGVSPVKATKLDVSAESKTEKKKSDFLTKLTAIREAQSERRKAREEKELIRESITQDFPPPHENEFALKEKAISIELTPSISREDSKEIEDVLEGKITVNAEVDIENKTVVDASEADKPVPVVKEAEDSIPVDFDTNWSESQGEWIEEYDEQWEEGDEHWVGLGKKFQKMEKEFEEEAMQMAALWEKEELEDDVFEEDAKIQQESELVDSDKKFNDWVKANLKVDSSEYEEEIEMKGKSIEEDIITVSIRERLELEGSIPSPLQHYPTAHDLSLKSQFDSDWVDLPADAEIEKLAHDIVCEGSDVENKFDVSEMMMYDEKQPRKLSDQGSDEDWEKIEIDEQIQDADELDRFAFPEKEGENERNIEELCHDIDEKTVEVSQVNTFGITIDKNTAVLYKNLEIIKAADASDVGITAIESLTGTTDPVNDVKQFPSTDDDQPKVPVRRKSKLSSSAMEEVLKSQSLAEVSSDIPPPLPEKTRHKEEEQKISDVYALPDKSAKLSKLEEHATRQIDTRDTSSVPQKPPRLNLFSLLSNESGSQKLEEEEREPEIPKKMLSKDGSPVTPLSFESDSNFFADSESDVEVKLLRQKNIHRKPAKYENELEDAEIDNISESKLEEKNDILESNIDIELDEDIDPALIEPLPRMKDADFDPELPILLGVRGRQITDIDDVNAPKAFREDTTRPLQLFKATKREISSENLSMISPVTADISVSDATTVQMLSQGLAISTEASRIPLEGPENFVGSRAYENKEAEKLYYNEAISPPKILPDVHLLEKQGALKPFQPPEELLDKVEDQKTEPDVPQDSTDLGEEMPFTEMEALSAVADYFFGRYNEITVTRPKKKAPSKPKAQSPIPPKGMSTSEVISVAQTEILSQMEQSATAVLQKESPSDSAELIGIIDQEIHQMENRVICGSTIPKETAPPPKELKPPTPTECLSFAEDYLFGCYNQVVPPKKTKNAPVVLAKIPKLGEASSLSRIQSLSKEQKTMTSSVSTPESPELPEKEPDEEAPEGHENSIPADATIIYDEVFHDLPPEMLSNQSFDESSIYYESFQDAVEDMRDNSAIAGGVVNVRSKNVHFEEPEIPVAPPRRQKGQQKVKEPITTVSSESYADEYLFRQYEQFPPAKKKLPECSEDFRMKQGFEPTQIPCDTLLMHDEQQEGVKSSEINVDTPLKSIEPSKFHAEYEFEESEQLLDSVTSNSIETHMMETTGSFESKDSISSSEHILISVKDSEIMPLVEKQVVVTDIPPQKSESFEELSIPDHTEVDIGSYLVSPKLNTANIDKAPVTDISSTVTGSQLSDMQSCDIKPYELPLSSNQQMEQFVFIDQTPDIIDDSYNLYDIQESLVCNLDYVDVKGNIEDECTDDSEQEWKRNEYRKNTLNASFLNSVSNKMFADDQEETKLYESQKSVHKKDIESDESEKFDSQKESHECTIDENKIHLHAIGESEIEELNVEGNNEGYKIADHGYLKSSKADEVLTEIPKFSEQLGDISIDSEHISAEVLHTGDTETAKEVKYDGSLTSAEYQTTAEIIFSEHDKKVLSEETAESILKINQEFVVTTSSETHVNQIQKSILSEADTLIEVNKSYPVIDQELSESGGHASLQHETIISKESDIMLSVSKIVPTEKKNYIKFSEEAEKDETAMITEELVISEDQQIDILEELEASGELSDDNVSSHSSVSTQIAISMKTVLKESEGDECSLNFEQSDNLEYDNEMSTSVSATAVSEYLADDFDKCAEISDLGFSRTEGFIGKLKSLEYEKEVNQEEYKSELTPIPSFESDQQTERYSPEISIEESDSIIKETFKDVLKEEKKGLAKEEFALKSPFNENIDHFLAEPCSVVIETKSEQTGDHVVSQDSANVEIQAAEITKTDENEIKLILPEIDETDLGSQMAEEPIVSHFYDEWYQNVEPSAKFTLLSAESIYAKYGSAESSESGNESDIDKTSTTDVENVANEIAPQNISLVDDVPFQYHYKMEDTERFDYATGKLLSMMNPADNSMLYDTTMAQEEEKAEDTFIKRISSETAVSEEESFKMKFENVKCDQLMLMTDTKESCDAVRSEISLSIHVEVGEYVQSAKDQQTADSKSTNKFSTSKSCQTEDSFEEDIFFDSFDDTFTIPSYIQLPIENLNKPSTSDISIQCELISIEDILSPKKVISETHTKVITSKIEADLVAQDSFLEPNLRRDQPEDSELPSKDKEESSCESFEDSDSDIFIESPSSQDELDVPVKKSFLYEVDSDTGFSSGSEYGWTKNTSLKQKELKKTAESSIKIPSDNILKEEFIASVNIPSVEYSCENIETEPAKITNRSVASGNIERDFAETITLDGIGSPLSPEIIERAMTPIAVPQFSSFEDDLVFVEVEEAAEVSSEDKHDEIVSTTPTVEFFYGPLPETVTIKSPPDINDKFFETASDLSESVSFSADRTESFSDSSISIPFAEQVSRESKFDAKVHSVTKDAEDESFADTSSQKGEVDDSISEYYPVNDSNVSLAPFAENDIFDVACSEFLTESASLLECKNLLSDNKNISGRLPDEKLKSSLSEVDKVCNLREVDQSLDEPSQDSAMKVKVLDYKEAVPNDFHKFEKKIEVHEHQFPETQVDLVSFRKAAVSEELQGVTKEQTAELILEQTAETLQCSVNLDNKSIISDMINHSSYTPSDTVGYLYHDNSLTFNDSYHTQSENLKELPGPPEEIQNVDSIDCAIIDETKMEASVFKANITSQIQSFTNIEEKLTTSISNETALNNELSQNTILADQKFEEITPIPEFAEPAVVLPDSCVKSTENVTDLSSEYTFESKCLLEEASPAANLKFPTVEVIASENTTVLSTAIEEMIGSVILIENQISEPITVKGFCVQDASTIPQDSEFQDIAEPKQLHQESSKISHAPSDIVRYLYYDDDISFDETTQDSFYSQSDVSDPASDKPQIDLPGCSDLRSDISVNPEFLSKVETTHVELLTEAKKELSSEVKASTSEVCYEESVDKPDSSHIIDRSLPSFEGSECIENWFELEESNGKGKQYDNEQHSSDRSSVFKDSEQPCIPEYILSPKLEDDAPIARSDVDEITDISTHFTMTDDSDRFSDIESDTSLNFEEDFILPIEMSDQEKGAELFESCADNEDERNLHTPEAKDYPSGFQFHTADPPIIEFIKHDIPLQILEKSKTGEKVSSREVAMQPSTEQVADSLNVNEWDDQKISKEISEELKENFEECITHTSSDYSGKEKYAECSMDQAVRKNIVHAQDELPLVKSDECIATVNQSETCAGPFVECLTSDEFVNQQLVKNNFIANKEENIDECITSNEIFGVSEEQFVECQSSDKLSNQKHSQEAHLCKVIPENSDKQLTDQSSEYLCYDENGNFPQLIESVTSVSSTADAKTNFHPGSLDSSCPIKPPKNASDDKSHETNMPKILPEDSIHTAHSSGLAEVSKAPVSQRQEINALQAEKTEILSFGEKDILEASCYILPSEDSPSISTDNWSDAESKIIEAEESIYDLPLEDISNIHFANNNNSFSSQTKVIDPLDLSTNLLESQKEETQKIGNTISETINVLNATTIDLNKFIVEEEKSEILAVDKSSMPCEIFESSKKSVINETMELFSGERGESFSPTSLSEQDPKHLDFFSDSLLSSDIKLVSMVKMETESEISSTMKEMGEVECMSVASGAKPTSSFNEAGYDIQGVQSGEISSKEVCFDDKIISSALSEAGSQESHLESQITSAVMEVSQLPDNVYISKTLELPKINLGTEEITKNVEIVDFKGCLSKDDLEDVNKEESDCKIAVLPHKSLSEYDNIPCDKVDFKGKFLMSDSYRGEKILESNQSFSEVSFNNDKKTLKNGVSSQLLEIVDFKLINNQDVTEPEAEKEKMGFKCADLVNEKSSANEESCLKINLKASSATVDFKGSLSNIFESNETGIKDSENYEILEEKVEILAESEKNNISSQIQKSTKLDVNYDKIKTEVSLETVDFKGHLISTQNSLEMNVKTTVIEQEDNSAKKSETGIREMTAENQREIEKSDVMRKINDAGSLIMHDKTFQKFQKVDFDKVATFETVDFKGALISDSLKITKDCNDKTVADIIEASTDSTPMLFTDIVYDSEDVQWEYGTFNEPIPYDPREMYGYGSYEQPVTLESEPIYDDDYILGATPASESQQQIYYEMMGMDSVTFPISSDESSELYSCAETLSATEDSSMCFHSVSEDLADAFTATTSEEFTDVPSHLTSTDGSDKWSDIEGDFILEDVEFDKDKTPMRGQSETEIYVKEEFAVNAQERKEDISKSFEVKAESMIILDSDRETDQKVVAFNLNTDSEKNKSILGLADLENFTQQSKDVKASSKEINLTEETLEKKSTEKHQVSHQEIFSTDSTYLKEFECHTEKSADLSVITTSEDFTESSSHKLLTASSEKWSDVKSEIDHSEKVSSVFTVEKEYKYNAKTASGDNAMNQEICADSAVTKDLMVIEESAAPLTEHYADIKSLKDSLTTVDIFSSFDAETAVSKTHEDTSTDISSQFEKTESDQWLEAETEHSISEVCEDMAFSVEKDGNTKVVFVEYEKAVNEVEEDIHSTEMPHATTTSTSSSSSYSDFETSDHTSDTYADISLQGATTENSDKWSDIEAEGLIDDVLFGNVHITETTDLTDLTHLIKKPQESRNISETPLSDDHSKSTQPIFETKTEISSSSAMEVKIVDIKIFTEIESDLSKESSSKEVSKFSTKNVDPDQTFIPTVLAVLSTPSSTIMSDDELTNVTPLEESDKWSDISGDTSLEEMDAESSVSLKASLKLENQESAIPSHEIKSNVSKTTIDETKEEKSTHTELLNTKSKMSMKVKDKLSSQPADSFHVECSATSAELIDSVRKDLDEITPVSSENVFGLQNKKLDAVSEKNDCELKLDKHIEIKSETIKLTREADDLNSVFVKSEIDSELYLEEKVEHDDSSSSKVIDVSDTLDIFTDVPTHTLASETSDAYCELDSDHSFEEIESPQEDARVMENQQDFGASDVDSEKPVDNTTQSLSEYYDSSIINEGTLEAGDNFALDAIPENELENYEEEYSLSEHFEINEDELIYPLPYNDDWIEQSFELKEYGIEAEFFGSGSDIHGIGIENEDYDDEDIQRAVDFNLSTFEENEGNIEIIGVSESFKTLSNDGSTHLKPDEFDTWSTADAPSIEEEFDEQDNVLSKIDELLAEDFKGLDIYQADSPLKYGEDMKAYTSRDKSTPDDFFIKNLTEITSSSLPKDTLLEIDKGCKMSDLKSVPDQSVLNKSPIETLKMETSFVFEEITENKYSAEAVQSKIKTHAAELNIGSELLHKVDSETISAEDAGKKIFAKELETGPTFADTNVPIKNKSAEEDLSNFSSKKTTKKESVELAIIPETKSKELALPHKIDIKSITPKDSAQTLKTKTETSSGEIDLMKVSTEVHKAECKTMLDETQRKVDSKLELDSKNLSNEAILKKDASKMLNTESDILTCDIGSTNLVKTVSETVSTKISIKQDTDLTSKTKYDSSLAKESVFLSKSTDDLPDQSNVLSSQDKTVTSASETSVVEAEATKMTCDKTKDFKGLVEGLTTSTLVDASISLPSDKPTIKADACHLFASKGEEISIVEVDVTSKFKSQTKISKAVDHSEQSISPSEEISVSDVLSPSDSSKLNKDILSERTKLSASKTDSSLDIPSKKLVKPEEKHHEHCTESKISAELSKLTESIQVSQQTCDSLKLSLKPTSESTKVQSNIPDQIACKSETYSVSEQSSTSCIMSVEQTPTAAFVTEVKPDIPKKTKRKSLDSKEETQLTEESIKKPTLPPKKSKQYSLSDSPSASLDESISSSSSVESFGSFESATSNRSRKGSLKSSDETSMHSLSPDVPSRRSRSSNVSSSRSTSRDSADSSHSRSSSLKIRRRSSNFIEPEPIDLSKRKASIDERMRKLQNEGKCATKDKAFIAAKLIEMQFEEEDALLASKQCNTVYHAVKFLTQLCEMCNCRFPINLMSSLVHCTHKACKECLKAHFTSLIYDRSVFTLLCPICHKPDITDQNIQEYFTHLDMTLRNILDDKVYDLFQRKLRDEVLTKDPNFHWCSQCSSGFIASPRLKKLYCPDCSAITCAMCHQTWELEHEGVHCERFQQWKDMHTPEPPPAGLVKFLIDRGISCPSCGLVYDQACGGCMMYKCSHCSFEFCGFCIHPLKRGRECSNEICDSRGLHIHHPQNCLFFLRDKDITEIQMLLEEESVTYLTIPPKDQIVKSRCQVREQKNVHGVLTEDRCGRDIEPYCGGLCRTHYYEYLTELLRKNNISPLSIMTIQDLQFMLRKSRILVPEKIKGETSEDYYERLLNLVTRTLT